MDGIATKILLEAKNISAGYSKKKQVLKNISLSIGKGELIGVIGKNGTGKSTLLKSLRGFIPLYQGSVLFKEKELAKYSERDLAINIGYLQQDVDIAFDYTAREIVRAGRYAHLKWYQSYSKKDEAIIDACMEYTGVLDLQNTPMRAMSGGQKQRVLLAKVLAQQTPLLFLDEPATGLDIYYQEEIYRFSQDLCKANKTVLMVVHDLAMAYRFCSRIIIINDGMVLADNTPEIAMSEKNLTEAYSVPMCVVKNPVTGHADIFSLKAENTSRQQELLKQISAI